MTSLQRRINKQSSNDSGFSSRQTLVQVQARVYSSVEMLVRMRTPRVGQQLAAQLKPLWKITLRP